MTGKMETPFYHDDTQDHPNFEHIPQYSRYLNHKVMTSKKNMARPNFPGESSRLKLLHGSGDDGGVNPNDAAIISGASASSLLPPADINLLKLASPDLEHLIIQSNQGLVTTSPAPSSTGSNFLYRNQVTNEQEGFADGFVKALADLHKQNQLIGSSGSASSSIPAPYQRGGTPGGGDTPVYTNLSSYTPGAVGTPSSYTGGQLPYAASVVHGLGQGGPLARRPLPPHGRGPDEPQTVPEVPPPPPPPPGDPAPGSPPCLSPIDLEAQERIKAERKRLRNRIAASKCRKRKLERISRLEEKVKVLKTQNADLASTAGVLREQVARLKEKVMNHVTNGCQISVSSATLGPSGEGTSC